MKYSTIKKPSYEEALSKKQARDALRAKNPVQRRTATRKPIRKGSSTKKTARAKKMELKRLICETYELPVLACSRWGEGKKPTRTDILRGMLWTVFSRFIRERDKDAPCISCGRHMELKQAGHYVPVGGNDVELCFDERNVNGECETCNAFDPFHLVPMRKNLINKYGIEVVEELERLRDMMRAVKWDESEYVTRIQRYL